MKKQSLLLVIFVYSVLKSVSMTCCSMEVGHVAQGHAVNQRLMQRIHALGFQGILRDPLHDGIIMQVAEGFLGKVLTFYEVKRDSVDHELYQRALNVVKYEVRNALSGTDACFDSEQDVVKRMVDDAWCANTVDGSFDITVCERMPVLFDLLVASQAHLEKAGTDGLRPLHVALSRGSLDLVERLLGVGVDTSSRIDKGATSVHIAAICGNVDIMKALWFSGACFDLETENGLRPLIGAIRKKDVGMVSCLLALGVKVSKVEQRLLRLCLPKFRYRELLAEQRTELAQELCVCAQVHGIVLEKKITDLILLFVLSNVENFAGRRGVMTKPEGVLAAAYEHVGTHSYRVDRTGKRTRADEEAECQDVRVDMECEEPGGREPVQKKKRVHEQI